MVGRWLGRLLRVLLTATGVLLMLLALYVSLGRELVPLLAEYQPELENRAQQALGMPLQIGSLEGSWEGFAPVLVARDVRLGEASNQVRLERVRVIPDLLGSALAQELKITDLQVDGLHLTLQQGADGAWALQGMPAPATGEPLSPALILGSLQRIGWLSLLDSQITLRAQGKAPVSLTYVNLSLRSTGSRQRLDGHLVLPDGQPLSWRLRSRLHPQLWQQAEAELYLSLPQSDWARWLPSELIQGWRAEHLQAGGDFWLTWAQGRVQRAVAQLHAPQLAGAYAQRAAVKLQDLAVNAYYARTEAGFQLQLDSLAVTLGETRWGDVQLGLTYQAPRQDVAEQWTATADRLDLTPLAPVVKALAPLPEAVAGALEGLQPRGALRNVQLDYRPQAAADQQLQFSGNLERVAINPYNGAPGVDNVSGSISGDLAHGELHLAADDFVLNLDQLFPKPWHYQQAHAQLNWSLNSEALTISSPYMQLDADEGKLAGDMLIRVMFDPKAESYMDLRVGLRDGDARYTEKYLPTRSSGLSPELASWLTTAIRAGQVDEGFFQYQGSLAANAPANSSAISLYFKVHGAELAYQPGWPALREATGEVFVESTGVRVQVAQGRVLDSAVSAVNVSIPTAVAGGVPRLALDGELQSSVADGLKILKEAPLGVASTFAGWQGQGALSGRLKLDIPLAAQQTPQVQVDFATDDAQLTMTEPKLALSKIKGAFRFNSATGLSAPDVRAQIFGREVRGRITAAGARGRARTQVEANGLVALKSLTEWLGVTRELPAAGVLPYRLQLTLDGEDSQLRVESTLKGLSLDLPAPFGKTASEARYLDWRMSLQGKEHRYWLSYEDLLSVAFAAASGAVSDGRGQLLLGKGQATLPAAKGLTVVGSLSEFDWDTWQAVRQRYLPPEATVSPDLLRSLALKVGSFHGFGLALNSLDAQAARGKASWLLNLDSDVFSGQVTVPDAAGVPIVAALQRLRLPPAASPSEPPPVVDSDPLASVDPRSIPPLDLTIAQVLQGDSPLGAWSLKARPLPNGTRFSEVNLDLKGLQVIGALNWEGPVGRTVSTYSGRLKGQNLADVLSAWGYAQNATSKNFRLGVEANWPGSPAAFTVKNLSGSLDIKLTEGRFLEVKGGSAAALRVFGLLNFNSLGRRLRMDFSDLTSSGLAYDTVKGVLQGTNGEFTTAVPVKLSGPTSIEVNGQVNLRQQTVDTRVRVNLPVASNLPLAALIVGAPVVGGAIYAADKLFGGGVSSLTSVEYRVVGAMDNPTVSFVKPY